MFIYLTTIVYYAMLLKTKGLDMKVSINGKEYLQVGEDKQNGYSTKAHRVFSIAKSKLGL